MVKVSTERLPESQVVLEIEVEAEQMERSLERAYRKLVQRVVVPGFRKGKTPRNMLERHVGRGRLVQEALDSLIPEAYNLAIDEHEVDPIGQPAIELVQEEPLSFKATVPVRPTVELGDYNSLRVEREAVSVDPKEVDADLEDLRHRYAIHEPAERPVRMGDIVRADVRGVIDGREVYAVEDAEFHLREGSVILLPGFAEGLVGAEKGVSKEVPVTPPSGSQPVSGESGTFTVIVKEVKEERLSELDDQFAREVGEGFATLDALRERLNSNRRERLEAEAEDAYRQKALAALTEQAEKLEFPALLVEREMERLVQGQARAVGQDVERYLQMVGRSPAELQEELRPLALEQVRNSLALSRLAEVEEVKVEPAEIDAEVEKLVSSSGPQAEPVRQMFSGPEAREAIGSSLVTRKTLDRLVEIAGQGVTKRAAKTAKGARKTATTKRKKRSTKAGTEAQS